MHAVATGSSSMDGQLPACSHSPNTCLCARAHRVHGAQQQRQDTRETHTRHQRIGCLLCRIAWPVVSVGGRVTQQCLCTYTHANVDAGCAALRALGCERRVAYANVRCVCCQARCWTSTQWRRLCLRCWLRTCQTMCWAAHATGCWRPSGCSGRCPCCSATLHTLATSRELCCATAMPTM